MMDKSEAYAWQLTWFFAMAKEEQRTLITPFVTKGFVREGSENFGANHIYGLSVSLNYTKGSCDESEELLLKLREKLYSLSEIFRKSDEWGFDVISDTEEWRSIRKIAKGALEADGYRVAPPEKPLDIAEYPEHFVELQ